MNDKILIIPFVAGMGYLFLILIVRGVRWIRGLSKFDKLRLYKSLLTRRTLQSIKEAFREGLLHRKIFKKNPVLGYMHMSLAFGWFLLIVVGHIEGMVAAGSPFIPIYHAVFFRYFETGKDFFMSGVFAFLMDFLLLFVLSGVSLAVLKRFKKQPFGLKKTTKLKTFDKIALLSLWFIFPLRLFAESVSAGLYHNGHFLTSGVGRLLDNFQFLDQIHGPAWVAYSVTLCK